MRWRSANAAARGGPRITPARSLVDVDIRIRDDVVRSDDVVGLHWDDGCDLGIKTGRVGAELFEHFAQAFAGPSDAKRGSGNAAGVVEDGETEIVLLLEFTVAIGNGRDEHDVCGFRQSFQVALTIRAPDTSVEGKNDGPDPQ